MKKFLILLTLGLLGTVAIMKNINQKKDILHFVETDQTDKNFGAFPPDIPEEQFDHLFI